MADLPKLHIKRGALKGQITRLNSAFEAESVKEDPNITNLALRLSKIEIVLDQFNDLQAQIETLVGDADQIAFETEQKERDLFEESYFGTVSAIRDFIRSFDPPDTPINNFVCPSPTQNAHQPVAPTPSVRVKLPTITLPEFDGNYENWLFFKDTFDSLVHNNQDIPPIQKFHYLRLSLKGKAADVISALEVSQANYSIARDLLAERYENTELLKSNHVSALFNLPTVHKENHASLRKLLDDVSKHLRALEVLKEPTDKWDTLIIHLLSSKLDSNTRRSWEDQKSKEKCTTFKQMSDFLKQRCRLLETLHPVSSHVVDNKPKTKSFVSSVDNLKCPVCKQGHQIYSCTEFLKLAAKRRHERAKSLQLCINCLKPGHNLDSCRASTCKKCERKHNTLLHFVNEDPPKQIESKRISVLETPSVGAELETVTHSYRVDNKRVLLPTALINIFDSKGNKIECRAYLDSCSQSNFITKDLFDKLNIPQSKINMCVLGINNCASRISQRTTVKISSRCTSFSAKVDCLITTTISNHCPQLSADYLSNIHIPPNIPLADPSFQNSSDIDILLGSGIFWELLCAGQIDLGKHKPKLQKTLFGWIVAGECRANAVSDSETFCLKTQVQEPLDDTLVRFWELEEITTKKPLSLEEQRCEDHFLHTFRRASSGEFIVDIPFKQPIVLGDSLNVAVRRFEAIERKLCSDLKLKQQYCAFMAEYVALGHMSIIENPQFDTFFYLPHHCVLRDESLTTKLRVVFDASCKTTNGKSLNDYQLVGPALQDELFSILVRFREHRYVLCADIEKMYRQVKVTESQRDYQRIVWRSSPGDPLSHYRLNTVTYGTASASFLAVRALQQTAHENMEQFPEASRIILRDFYMDDLITGHDSIQEQVLLRDQIISILSQGHFTLRKWVSNDNSILNGLSRCDDTIDKMEICDKAPRKALGLQWTPSADQLSFRVKIPLQSQKTTKRTILSTIAQLFDPLGLIGPCIVVAKIIIQILWSLRLDWDESIPQALFSRWTHFREELSLLLQVKIPRFVSISQYIRIEIHGFSDASEKAYGACLYIRSVDSDGNIISHLLCSKSRVSPTKTVSIPRLELCAAQLLARLTSKVLDGSSLSFNLVHYWCDSTIVHSWIRTPSNLLKTFVANRTAEIQELTNVDAWRHVRSEDNPADLLSRGADPSVLLNSSLWWSGPSWLSQPESEWPQSSIDTVNAVPELKVDRVLLTTQNIDENYISNKLKDYSQYSKIQRILAYCLRFVSNLSKHHTARKTGPLSPIELEASEVAIVKIAQSQAFKQDIETLQNSKPIHNTSKLLGLHPFLDQQGVLRVGGRIGKSDFNYDKKHPAIIPQHHVLSLLLAKHEHRRLMHAGPQSTLYSLREKFWPISGRSLVKRAVRECMICFRFNARPLKYLMSDLPKDRVNPSRPFSVCGVDYGGPYFIRDRTTRNFKAVKAYLCLFVCFSTKAVHLELAHDLSAEAFLAALRRFMSRRGRCQKIYSDNATNFKGAEGELATFLRKSGDKFITEMSVEGVDWSFIPPRSPHFGGLWEAGIRSAKHHIKRVVGESVLSYEQLYTLLVQIEACLNSRPIQSMSSNPDDPVALTPAHFLIGEPITSLPEPNLADVAENRLSKYQLIQRKRQHFWARWSKEYISELQTRIKWKRNHPSLLSKGSLVLVRDDNLPPMKWSLGRIVDLHPGADGATRVVSVKTVHGVFKRPVVKLCSLPENELN